MRVAPAAMAVHTRFYHDLMGTLPSIPVGIAGGKETLVKLLYPTVRGCKKRDTSCPCPTRRYNGTKQQHHRLVTKLFEQLNTHGDESHATPPHPKRSHTSIHPDRPNRLRVKISRRYRPKKEKSREKNKQTKFAARGSQNSNHEGRTSTCGHTECALR